MQRSKLFSAAMMAILALTALTASTASAKPEFLDNVKFNTFSGNGGASKLEVLGKGLKITCSTTSTVSGEILGNEEGTIKDIDLRSCTALGFSANSLGDAGGRILTGSINFKLCYISESTKEVGLYLEKINVHVEVPLAGILINFTGSIIGKIGVINSLQTGNEISFEQGSPGDQKPVRCNLLGKELNASLLASSDSKHEKNESASLVVKLSITFAQDITIDA